MAKYSYEFKKEIVDAYLRDEVGYQYLSNKYGIGNGNKKQIKTFRLYTLHKLFLNKKDNKKEQEYKNYYIK